MGEDLLLLGLNLAGIVVFAASGAVAAVAKQLDLFGVAVVGVVTALGGGALRDVAINEAPPIAFTDWRYPVTAATTAVVVFWIHGRVSRLRRTMLTLDAAGLALFTVVGTENRVGRRNPAGRCLHDRNDHGHRRWSDPGSADGADPGCVASRGLRRGVAVGHRGHHGVPRTRRAAPVVFVARSRSGIRPPIDLVATQLVGAHSTTVSVNPLPGKNRRHRQRHQDRGHHVRGGSPHR